MRTLTATTKASWIGIMGGLGLAFSILGATWAQQLPTGRPGPPPAARTNAAPAEPQESSHSAKPRLELAQKALKILERMQESGEYGGQSEFDDVYRWSRRAIDAKKELGGSKAELVAALEGHLAWMKKWESVTRARHARGELKPLNLLEAQYRLMEAESWLAEAKANN